MRSQTIIEILVYDIEMTSLQDSVLRHSRIVSTRCVNIRIVIVVATRVKTDLLIILKILSDI